MLLAGTLGLLGLTAEALRSMRVWVPTTLRTLITAERDGLTDPIPAICHGE